MSVIPIEYHWTEDVSLFYLNRRAFSEEKGLLLGDAPSARCRLVMPC
jgi:hypothetical protein